MKIDVHLQEDGTWLIFRLYEDGSREPLGMAEAIDETLGLLKDVLLRETIAQAVRTLRQTRGNSPEKYAAQLVTMARWATRIATSASLSQSDQETVDYHSQEQWALALVGFLEWGLDIEPASVDTATLWTLAEPLLDVAEAAGRFTLI